MVKTPPPPPPPRAGPKPLKSFTRPPEYTEETDSDEYTYTDDSEYTSDEDSESGPPRAATRVQDEFLTQVYTTHAIGTLASC